MAVWELYRGQGKFSLISSEAIARGHRPKKGMLLDSVYVVEDIDEAEELAKHHMEVSVPREPSSPPMIIYGKQGKKQ